MIPKNMLEIHKIDGDGYAPLVRFESWRVARLRYCDELLPQNIKKLQRHEKTDELFVLLEGNCTLFLADGADQIEKIYAQPLKPLYVYNIKKGTWHSHTLSPDASVLIVENDSTSEENSPEIELTGNQCAELISLCG